MNILRIIPFLFLFAAFSLSAQDLHLSNYQQAGMLFNPALTSAGKNNVRVGVQYRSQWASIGHAFTTIGTTAEVKYRQLGFGFQLHQNHAGPASLKTTGMMLTGAYHKPLAQDGSLSLGVGVGRQQRRINPTALTFDNQYTDGIGFDSAQPSGETFQRTSVSTPDIATGLLWQGHWGNSHNLKSTLGLSFSHILPRNVGFFSEKSELPMRTVVHGSLDINVANHFSLRPSLLLQKQGTSREVVGGIGINGSFDKGSDFNAGMAYRVGDAVILQVGFEINDKSIWVSYDANDSSLGTVTGGIGAFELGMYLAFGKTQRKQEEGKKTEDVIAIGDADKDGVADDLDDCPLEPGLPKFNGCNDRDSDGIFDSVDACPEIFGHPDNQGCPAHDRDTDRDGIADPDDHCVFIKGQAQLHGCPDTDRDGLSDLDDHCPYLRGKSEFNGCPSAEADAASYEPAVLVEFETDQSTIEPFFQAQLNEFARQIREAKDALSLVISGHTDTEGTAAYNYELGLRRAKTVSDYLRRQGIPVERIEIISYGEALPKRSNGTHDGKAENRRAEVALVRT